MIDVPAGFADDIKGSGHEAKAVFGKVLELPSDCI
jgi:hypothetical protein